MEYLQLLTSSKTLNGNLGNFVEIAKYDDPSWSYCFSPNVSILQNVTKVLAEHKPFTVIQFNNIYTVYNALC